MSQIKVEHVTELRYREPVAASYNEARMLPQTREGQFVTQASLDVSSASTQRNYVDFWGTLVTAFEVLTPHDELRLCATSVSVVQPADLHPAHFTWEMLATALETSVELTDYLQQTSATEPDAEMLGLAERLRGDDVDGTARAICQLVGETMNYVTGATGVNSLASEAWESRMGVCQDIAQICLSMLRVAGIPARYVSGYLHPQPDAALGTTVTGESHAWVEWYAGEWRGYDPTNQAEISDRHVYVGHGRDYGDVAPLRGVYAGGSKSESKVYVLLTRLR